MAFIWFFCRCFARFLSYLRVFFVHRIIAVIFYVCWRVATFFSLPFFHAVSVLFLWRCFITFLYHNLVFFATLIIIIIIIIFVFKFYYVTAVVCCSVLSCGSFLKQYTLISCTVNLIVVDIVSKNNIYIYYNNYYYRLSISDHHGTFFFKIILWPLTIFHVSQIVQIFWTYILKYSKYFQM